MVARRRFLGPRSGAHNSAREWSSTRKEISQSHRDILSMSARRVPRWPSTATMTFPISTACSGCWVFQSDSNPGSMPWMARPYCKGFFLAICRPTLCPEDLLRTTSKVRGRKETNFARRTSSFWPESAIFKASNICATSPCMPLTDATQVSTLNSLYTWPCFAHTSFHSWMLRQSSASPALTAQTTNISDVRAHTVRPPEMTSVLAS
mmetsp:Transcript_52196/g.146485  ORF Transcript_52196/g.146485 Transcript_52196/m.146485 type:complete len:207 (-) Transcript_52196:614-1234(-)